jgi:hypothetical protein
VSTETLLVVLPTSGNKKVRIVTVAAVQFYKAVFTLHFSGKWVGSMFGQIWPTSRRSGVISDKNAQILKFLSGQKWGVSGNFGIKPLWGLSGVLPYPYPQKPIPQSGVWVFAGRGMGFEGLAGFDGSCGSLRVNIPFTGSTEILTSTRYINKLPKKSYPKLCRAHSPHHLHVTPVNP